MSTWAVVPAKSLAAAKGRLAPLLTAGEREQLVRAMLTDVVAALLAAPDVRQVLVVSPDAAALELAAALGARPVPELSAAGPQATWKLEHAVEAGGRAGGLDSASAGGVQEAGLNAALDFAAGVAIAGGASALLALPADLPLATAADVMALTTSLPAAPAVVLAPTVDGGTGALLRCPPLALPARFGPSSLRAHLRLAEHHSVNTRVVGLPHLALDIDRPADLLRLVALPPCSRTQALLADWRLPQRWATQPAVASALDGR